MLLYKGNTLDSEDEITYDFYKYRQQKDHNYSFLYEKYKPPTLVEELLPEINNVFETKPPIKRIQESYIKAIDEYIIRTYKYLTPYYDMNVIFLKDYPKSDITNQEWLDYLQSADIYDTSKVQSLHTLCWIYNIKKVLREKIELLSNIKNSHIIKMKQVFHEWFDNKFEKVYKSHLKVVNDNINNHLLYMKPYNLLSCYSKQERDDRIPGTYLDFEHFLHEYTTRRLDHFGIVVNNNFNTLVDAYEEADLNYIPPDKTEREPNVPIYELEWLPFIRKILNNKKLYRLQTICFLLCLKEALIQKTTVWQSIFCHFNSFGKVAEQIRNGTKTQELIVPEREHINIPMRKSRDEFELPKRPVFDVYYMLNHLDEYMNV